MKHNMVEIKAVCEAWKTSDPCIVFKHMFSKCPKSGNMSETHGNPAVNWGSYWNIPSRETPCRSLGKIWRYGSIMVQPLIPLDFPSIKPSIKMSIEFCDFPAMFDDTAAMSGVLYWRLCEASGVRWCYVGTRCFHCQKCRKNMQKKHGWTRRSNDPIKISQLFDMRIVFILRLSFDLRIRKEMLATGDEKTLFNGDLNGFVNNEARHKTWTRQLEMRFFYDFGLSISKVRVVFFMI